MMKSILVTNGYEVVGEAGDGAKVLKLYTDLKPDLVIMNVLMPGMDGLEALEKILSLDPEAKVLISSDRSIMKEKALLLGSKGSNNDTYKKQIEQERFCPFLSAFYAS